MKLKLACFLLLSWYGPRLSWAQKALPTTVPAAEMQRVYEEIKTPYKYGLVLVTDDNKKKMDCPSVFRKNGQWWMTYIIYDGRGYETWLAQSKDLLKWETKGKIAKGNTAA